MSIDVPPTPPARRRWSLGAAACALAFAAAACGSGGADAGAEGETRSFASDHTDEEVRIPAEPKRIVAIGWAVTPLISVEEAELVGVSRGTQDMSLTPEELERVEELPDVGTDLEINIEQVAELEPDLIVSGLASAMEYDYSELEKIAPVAVAAMNEPAEWKEMNERVADAAGVADAHAELIEKYDRRAAEISEEYADVLEETDFAAVAAYGDGNWTLEHEKSFGPNIPSDAGLRFSEEAEDGAFSESHAVEDLDILNGYDAVLVREEDGEPEAEIGKIMEQGPWKETGPAKDDKVFAVPQLGAMSYTTGMLVFDELEKRVLEKL
ncbi:ABC transporter substrate-binding protein [Nocardiopsis potens]|uniref:ABC transporter substrate-binding protein n=1 Tax=Nocardiopsis potens TaxID=1246458 RepID=UPI000347E57B|nr:ABC transporter substrate-binding protein [Nocardiopsis potens]